MDWLRRWVTKEPSGPPVVMDETEREREAIRARQEETAAVVAALRAHLVAVREAQQHDHQR